MRTIILSVIAIMMILIQSYQMSAQKYITKNGEIQFYSDTPLETIQANNRQVNAALDIFTGDLVFKVLMKSFEFEKALMQEHFNENYIESDKFPNAIFQGKITNIYQIDVNKSGQYEALIEGEMNMHGITQKISEKGTLTIEGDKIEGYSKFYIKPSDYNIKIPKAVINNIAETIEVTVNVELNKL